MQEHSVGIVEWFKPRQEGERERAQFIADKMYAAGFRQFRFDISWAELMYEEWVGTECSFYDFLIPLLAERFELLPNLTYTPPSLGIVSSCAAPPKDVSTYSYAVDQVCSRWGRYFDYLELWNEPNSKSYWRFDLDPEYERFRAMIAGAIQVLDTHGKRAVLAGISPIDLRWLCLMESSGLLSQVAAVGIHGFPGTWDHAEFPWKGWERHLNETRTLLAKIGSPADVWITEAGASSRKGVHLQREVWDDVSVCSASRRYWYAAMDFEGSTVQEQTEGWVSPDDFHMGLMDIEWQSKPLLKRLLGRTDALCAS